MAGIPVETRGPRERRIPSSSAAASPSPSTPNPSPTSSTSSSSAKAKRFSPDFSIWRPPSGGISPREAFLARIAEGDRGAYVPRFYQVTTGEDGRITAHEPVDPAFPRRIVRPWAADLDAFPTEQGIITEGTELGGMYLTEVSRGCRSGLPFLRRRLCLPARPVPERRDA